MANLQDVRKLLREAHPELFRKANVVATGVGYKKVEGKATKELGIICSVATKQSKQSLSAQDLIPSTIQGVPVDVEPTGLIYAQQDPTGRFRPAPGGVSVGHFRITAGTLGIWVRKNNKFYILSNNHVLANSNDAAIGDAILQPGPYDGGSNPADQIATLSEFVPIQFEGGGGGSPCPFANGIASVLNGLAAAFGSSTRLKAVYAAAPKAAQNLVDAAIAEPLSQGDVLNEILNIGAVTQTAEGSLGMAIKKMGRTTGFTTGSIIQIDVTSQVSYGAGKVGVFVDQLMAGNMSAGGDSGSAVVSSDNKLVGLLFAGSNTSTIINRIQNVFLALNITL
ncbi:MAG: hypothetical protein HUU32_11065 [Calditrichaceae bacterium]|nr:S1 family peptidase [Calditrichia bacterium]NUQ41926.1 hypothetical protein [Calditrichaceae bacterium]